uniref:DUF4209 domain-containing protein n=1 Tax=Rhabditophanes sp. KR3021 TaxID=114890 RepID=A0AC35U415_9BILA
MKRRGDPGEKYKNLAKKKRRDGYPDAVSPKLQAPCQEPDILIVDDRKQLSTTPEQRVSHIRPRVTDNNFSFFFTSKSKADEGCTERSGTYKCDNEIVPFKRSEWLQVRDWINMPPTPENVIKIVTVLKGFRSRDAHAERLGLTITEQCFSAYLSIHKLNKNDVYEESWMKQSIGMAINRIVGCFSELHFQMDKKRPDSIKDSLRFFDIEPIGGDVRNDIAHGSYPSFYSMFTTLGHFRGAIIKYYWNKFPCNLVPVVENTNERRKLKQFVDYFCESVEGTQRFGEYNNYLTQDLALNIKECVDAGFVNFCEKFFSKDVLLNSGERSEAFANSCEGSIFVPSSLMVVVMRLITQQLADGGYILDLIIYMGQLIIDAFDDEAKVRLNYWFKWFIKRHAKNFGMNGWKIVELFKILALIKDDVVTQLLAEKYPVEYEECNKILNEPQDLNLIEGDGLILVLNPTNHVWGSK